VERRDICFAPALSSVVPSDHLTKRTALPSHDDKTSRRVLEPAPRPIPQIEISGLPPCNIGCKPIDGHHASPTSSYLETRHLWLSKTDNATGKAASMAKSEPGLLVEVHPRSQVTFPPSASI